MSCGMIKNATVQLPEIQVVKTAQCFELQVCDSAHIAREAMETLHGNLMETEAAMETQAAPAFFLAVLDGDAETVSKMLSTADDAVYSNWFSPQRKCKPEDYHAVCVQYVAFSSSPSAKQMAKSKLCKVPTNEGTMLDHATKLEASRLPVCGSH